MQSVIKQFDQFQWNVDFICLWIGDKLFDFEVINTCTHK